MPIETRSNNALFRRAEQLKRWEESDTNKVPTDVPPHKKSKIKFSDGCVFLAACAASDTEEVEHLLEQEADINTANVDGLTALHQACIDDNLDMVQFLVEHECDVNQGDNEGWTPLHATASCGFVSIAKYLIENGADVAAVNNDGDLPIDIAESPKMEELLSDVLDEKGIDCDDARSEEERIMLEDANQWLNSEKYQDQIHLRTGASALHVAAAKGYIKVMNILIKAGADLNAQDNDGWTPLHAAAHWGQKEACAILGDNLANMDIQNFVGQTCFDVAEPELVKLLEELKKKQASMQKERPEIQAILQRTCTRPPLKRRTSVTRMSGQEKSKSVMKDTKAERAHIEQLSLPEEEVVPAIEENTKKVVAEKPCVVCKETQAPTVERIPSWKKLLRRSSENLNEDTAAKEEPMILKKPKNEEPDEKLASESSNGPSTDLSNENASVMKNSHPELPSEEICENRVTVSLPSSPSDGSSDSLSQGKRSFIPPVRDEESELQRKAHAKRVRETRRSTQGVLLEDVKTAELQYIIKVTQEARDHESDEQKDTKSREQNHEEVKESEDLSSKKSSDVSSDFKKEDRGKKNRPESLDTSLQCSDTNKSSNPSSPDTSPSVTLVLRQKTPSVSDEQSSPESRNSQGTPGAIQRRRRPKRRSTGVVHLDSDDAVEESNGDKKSPSKDKNHEQKEEGTTERRHKYGSSSYPDISSDASSRSEASSRYSSLSCSKSSLNEDGDKDFKKLYEDLKRENEKLKAVEKEAEQLRETLRKTEEELERTKKLLKKITEANNSRNTMSEIEKKERRALERKLSEMEEEVKTVSKLKAENEKLKAENRTLSRVLSRANYPNSK